MNGQPRRLRTILILTSLIVGLIALAVLRLTWVQPAADQVRQQLDQQVIEKVLTDQAAAWNRGDLDSFMVGYWHSPDLTFYGRDGPEFGWDDTLRRFQRRYQSEGKEMGKLTFSDLKIEVLGPDAAFVRGQWRVEKSKETLGGLFTLIVRRTPDGWRIMHDHTS